MRLIYTLLLVLILCTCGRAQTSIKGTVIDAADQSPLIGVSILAKGTTTGTVSDIDGKFSLIVPKGVKKLVLSYTGYETMEHRLVAGETDLVLRMKVSAAILEEVVVVGYGTMRKRDVTGAVQSLSSAPSAKRRLRKGFRNKRQQIAKQLRPEPTTPGSYNKITPNTFQSVADEPISTLSTDVDRAAYANVRSLLEKGQLPPPDAVRIEEMVNYFPYQRAEETGADPIFLNAEIITCPWQPSNQLLRVTIQAPLSKLDASGEKSAAKPASNLVFLLDVSGSMSGPKRLPLVKESLKMLTRALSADDKVSIVVYAGAAGLVLPPTVATDTTTIFASLDHLQSGGSTAGGAGIQLAYKTARENFIAEGNNRVIIATDGDFNVGISNQNSLLKLIEKERESGVYLTVLGFGRNNYQEGMMQELADRGNGNHAYIDRPAEARKILVEEMGGTLFTVAKDVKAQLEFKPEFIESYRLVGYENRLLNTEDFDDDTKDAAEMGAGHFVTILYELKPTKNWDKARYIASLRVRYKPAKGGRSRKLMFPIAADALPDDLASTDVRWAAAVAEFGMLLRGEEYVKSVDYDHCLELARNNVGQDAGGYRAEMVGLIEKAAELAKKR